MTEKKKQTKVVAKKKETVETRVPTKPEVGDRLVVERVSGMGLEVKELKGIWTMKDINRLVMIVMKARSESDMLRQRTLRQLRKGDTK